MAEGTVCCYTSRVEEKIPHYNIKNGQVQREIKRLEEAFEFAKNEMRRMIQVSEAQFDVKATDIFKTHLVILEDVSFFSKIREAIKENKINAEHAVSDVFDSYIKKYDTLEGHFKELTHDVVDTRDRLLNAFVSETGHFKCEIGDQRPVIVAAERLTPSMVLSIPREHVLAFVTKEGGFTSHATILARSYGVPIIFGIDVEKELDCGMHAVVNGSLGKVILEPDEETKKYYEAKIDNLKKKKLVCLNTKHSHAHTKVGSAISLKINISVPEEFSLINELPHDGVGLLRTEFLFIQSEKPPTEDEQYRVYKQILSQDDRPVTVRILDLSNDKLPAYLESFAREHGEVVFRGAIAVDVFRDLYLAQFKALLRANENSNMRLLYPMVADLSDLNTYRGLLEEAKRELKKSGVRYYDKGLLEGVMIETPSAVMLSGSFLKEVDFVNIGSNDLLQYTLAAPRGNQLSEKRYHILHPALAKFIEIVAIEGKKAKKEVCLCGELASFEEFYPLMLGLGLRSFSVSVYKFSDIQCELANISENIDKELVREFYKADSKEKADKYFMKYL